MFRVIYNRLLWLRTPISRGKTALFRLNNFFAFFFNLLFLPKYEADKTQLIYNLDGIRSI